MEMQIDHPPKIYDEYTTPLREGQNTVRRGALAYFERCVANPRCGVNPISEGWSDTLVVDGGFQAERPAEASFIHSLWYFRIEF